jgi:hypothetical protein
LLVLVLVLVLDVVLDAAPLETLAERAPPLQPASTNRPSTSTSMG